MIFSPRAADRYSSLKVTPGRGLAAGENFTYMRLQIHKFNDFLTQNEIHSHIFEICVYTDIENNTVKDTLLTS